jgi:hypothetical protein
MPNWALAAGTNDPICAMMVKIAFCLKNVLLPPMFGLEKKRKKI